MFRDDEDLNGDGKPLERCVFATPTGERWCNCRVACRVVVCSNRLRNEILRTRSDGASRHSYDATGYNALLRTGLGKTPIDAPEGAFFVRSAFCGRAHCVDFAPKEADDDPACVVS